MDELLMRMLERHEGRRNKPYRCPAGKLTIVEVDEIVPLGALDPDSIHTPGIFVQRIVKATLPKRIEQRTVRKKEVA